MAGESSLYFEALPPASGWSGNCGEQQAVTRGCCGDGPGLCRDKDDGKASKTQLLLELSAQDLEE